MTFTYYWKSPDNARHAGEIEADDRDAAFAALRAQGIRAIKVEPKGWETGRGYRGVRKRIVAAIAIAAALGAAVLAYFGGRNAAGNAEGAGAVAGAARRGGAVRGARVLESEVVEIGLGRRIAKPRPRRQIPELRVTDEALRRIFPNPSERILVAFAQPGRDAGGAPVALTAEIEENFYDVEGDAVWIEADDPKPIADLKRVVAGIKEETALYLASGKTVRELIDYYVQRQRMESEYRKSIIATFDPSAPDAKTRRAALNQRLDALDLERLP